MRKTQEEVGNDEDAVPEEDLLRAACRRDVAEDEDGNEADPEKAENQSCFVRYLSRRG